MATEYKPNSILQALADICATIPADPSEPIEPDGYGSLGLEGAFNIIRNAAIAAAMVKRKAIGASPDLDLDDDDTVVTTDGCGFDVALEYCTNPWEGGQWSEYETIRVSVSIEDMLKGPDITAIRARREAEEAAERERQAKTRQAEQLAALEKERLKQQALARLTPEERRALGHR